MMNVILFSVILVRALIGALFISAGTLKLLDPAAFGWTIFQYGLIPRVMVDPLAVVLPVVEVAAGAGLIFNRQWSYGIVGGLLALFVAALGYAIINGLNVDCGCFGSGEPGPAGLRNAFLRDVVMLIGLAAAWRFREQRPVQGRTDRQQNHLEKEDMQ
jgi:uncharacterized membrane protein YphA (DoxX/SURF4 family)